MYGAPQCFSTMSSNLKGRGWSGGAKVLGKLSVPGRPTSLDDSRARAYCSCSRCGWGLFGHFFPHLSILFSSPSLWETARYRLKYCLKGPLNPKQPTKNLKGNTFCDFKFAPLDDIYVATVELQCLEHL